MCAGVDVHGVTDLSGDSGAIGRLMVGGSKEDPQLQIDLKGVFVCGGGGPMVGVDWR